MRWFNFFNSNKEKTYKVFKDKYLFIEDVVSGDNVKIWKPEGKNLICFYNKELGPNGILMGKIENKNLSRKLDENNNYSATVDKVNRNMIFIKVNFLEDSLENKNKLKNNDSQLSIERFDRIKKREEKEIRVANEKKARLQVEYDKVLINHKNNIEKFNTLFQELNSNFIISKLEKLKLEVEKEINKIELKEDKREDFFSEKSEKWQESEKGEIYEDITFELSSLKDKGNLLLEKIIELLNKKDSNSK